MLPLVAISTLLGGTAFYTFYRWAVNKGYIAKKNLKQFAPKFLTENSAGSTLKRYIPTNLKYSLNNSITREKSIDFFDVGGPMLCSKDVDYCLPNYSYEPQQY